MKLNENARRSDDLDDDACTEILLRLPVKSVIRFKSVSKRWLSLISTPHFRRLHTLRCQKPPPPALIIASNNSKFLYFNPSDTANPTKMIPFTITRPNHPKILSSSNGLLLLYNGRTKYKDLHVYNPSTHQSRQLTLAHNDDDESTRVAHLHLVFDPSLSIHYKVVCVRADLKPDMTTYQMEIFDSESGTWNVCREPIFESDVYMPCYELNSASTALYFSNMIYGIPLHRFDIDRNTLSFLGRPTLADHQGQPCSEMLQVSNGCLYYVSLQCDGKTAAIWELQLQRDDPCRSLWSLKHRQTLHPPLQYARIWYPNLLRFITDTSTLLIHVYGCIVAYNFVDKSYSELLDDQRRHLSADFFSKFCYSSLHVHQFTETLALL